MTVMSEDMRDDDEGAAQAIDEKTAKADIAAGARALKHLIRTAGHNWTSGWSIAVRGWRGLREVAFKRAGTRDPKAQAYRSAIGDLLAQPQNLEYRNIPKETRAAMTRLVGHIDAIDAWYATLSVWDRERWTNPQTIVKHAPPHLLVGQGHNQPKRPRAPPRRKGNPEAESLRAVLVKVIRRLAKYEPDALELLDDLYAGDPDDGVGNLGGDDGELE
jgi:hypothetical protein